MFEILGNNVLYCDIWKSLVFLPALDFGILICEFTLVFLQTAISIVLKYSLVNCNKVQILTPGLFPTRVN